MKRSIFSMGMLCAFLVSLLFVSCDKEEEQTALIIDLLKKAQIEGYVYANLDLTDAGLEKAPEGTKLILAIDYWDLNPDADNGQWRDTVTVDANGMFKAEVPATDDGVDVDIIGLPFYYDQVQPYGSYEGTVRKYFTAFFTDVDVTSNELQIVEISYNANDFDDRTPLAQISGQLVANVDTVGQFDDDETGISGVEITFYTSEWSIMVTTGANGSYTAEIPAGDVFDVKATFIRNRIVETETDVFESVAYEYEINTDRGPYSGIVENVDFNAGGGSEVE